VNANLFVGSTDPASGLVTGVTFQIVPYLRDDIIDLSVLATSSGYFTGDLGGDWPSANGWTNVAVMGRVSMIEGSGVVMQAQHPSAHQPNNFVVLLEAKVTRR